MARQRPIPVGGAKKAPPTKAAPPPPARRPAPRPAAPAPDETDDILEDAFGGSEPEPMQTKSAALPPPAAKRPVPVGGRARPAPVGAKQDEEPEYTYGTKGMPPEVARARGVRGSGIFGPQSKSPVAEDTGNLLPPPQTASRGPRAGGAGAGAAKRLPLDRPIETVEDARAYLEETYKPWADLTEEEKFTRNYCYEILVTDKEAKREMVKAIMEDDRSLSYIGATGFEPQTGDAAVEEVEEGGEPRVAPRYTMPTGLVVTYTDLWDFVLKHARAKSYTTQREIDQALGVEIAHEPGYRALKNEAQKTTQEEMARTIASHILDSIQEPSPPDDESEDEDDLDDGSVYEDEGQDDIPVRELTVERDDTQLPPPGRRGPSGASSPREEAGTRPASDFEKRRNAFEGAKLALRHRGEAIICADCKQPSTFHKGLKGVGMAETNKSCPGFVAESEEQRDALVALIHKAEQFKAEFADFLGQTGGAGADTSKSAPVSAAAEAAGPGQGRVVGAGSRQALPDSDRANMGASRRPVADANRNQTNAAPAVKGQPGGAGPPSKRMENNAADVGPGQSGQQPTDEFDGVGHRPGGPRSLSAQTGTSVADTGGERAGEADANGGADEDEVSPVAYREEFEKQRRAWAADVGGPLTEKLTWDINYPHVDGYEVLPTPHSVALDHASVDRRNRMARTVINFLGKAFFTKEGLLREDIEYGSCSWRVFVAARKLAQTIESYAAGRRPEETDKLRNLVERAARNYVAAHIPVEEGSDDPDFATYADLCAEAKRPIGTPIEEIMGQ